MQKVVGAVAATAITFSVGAITVAPAWAVDNVKPFGTQERINDWGTGGPLIGYTVRDLSPSSDPVPHNGQLYEATVTVDAFGSWATPVVPMFNARAEADKTTASSATQASEERCRRAARRLASSISTSWAMCPTASSTTTAFGTFSLGSPVPPRGVHAPSGSSAASPGGER
jgi:Domain of unknown function (DUF1942)